MTLTAAIQYLAAAKLGWQTLVAGISGRSYRVPIAMFNHVRRVHIRIMQNDGFSTATETSGLLTLPRS